MTILLWALAGAASGCAPLREMPVLGGPLPAGGAGDTAGDPGRDASGTPAAIDARPPPDTSGPEAPRPMPPADFTAQLGTWSFVDGTITVTCPSTGPSTDPLVGGGFDLQRGTDAPLHYLAGGCTWKLDGSGTTATFRQGQICSSVNDSATRFIFTIVFGQLTFAAGPRSKLDVEMSVASSDLPYTCNLKMAGNASKPTGGGGLVY